MKHKEQFKLIGDVLDKLAALVDKINENERLRKDTAEFMSKQTKPSNFAKGGIVPKGINADLEREEILRKTNCGLPESILYDNPLISADYLLLKHPFLTIDQAKDLQLFCITQGIEKKECYGNGWTILHEWIDFKLRIPKNYND